MSLSLLSGKFRVVWRWSYNQTDAQTDEQRKVLADILSCYKMNTPIEEVGIFLILIIPLSGVTQLSLVPLTVSFLYRHREFSLVTVSSGLLIRKYQFKLGYFYMSVKLRQYPLLKVLYK